MPEPLIKQLAIEIAELLKLDQDDKVMTAEQAADYLKINPGTLRALAKADNIPHVKVGKILRFHRDALDIWLGV